MMARLGSLAAMLAASFSGGAAGQTSPPATRLFNGRDLGEWIAVEQGKWKVERGLLVGASDGGTAGRLVFGGRDLGDFVLQFEARVRRGAALVTMRGHELEIGAPFVRWRYFASVTPVSSFRLLEWTKFRISAKGGQFDISVGDAKPVTLISGHPVPGGKLVLAMPERRASEVEFRNVLITE